MDFIKRYQKQIIICAGVIIGIIILGCVLLHPTQHTIDVKVIQWDYTVYIDEFQVVHNTNKTSYPNDAYNVVPRTKTTTKTVRDKDGKEHTETETRTVYDYDVNRWMPSRYLTTSDFDHEPYFAEVVLKESTRSDNIGAERISSYEQKYYASGTLVNESDNEIHTVLIDHSIWDVLRIGDQLNYEQRTVGEPYNVQIAQ